MAETHTNIAGSLLKIQAVKINTQNPFTWASGMRSPLYCDNRAILSFPEARTAVKKAFAATIRAQYPETYGVAGVATAGIPHGALAADELDLPFIYVRSAPKGHGLQNLIEGRIEPGKKYVVIEDLVSTGGSSLKAIDAIYEAGGEVCGLVAIFSYGLDKAFSAFSKAGVQWTSLINLEQLLHQALLYEYIQPADQAIIVQWQNDPVKWSDNFEKLKA